MDRVARVRVVVSDLRRSWIAAAGLWLVSFPLGFHAVSRHDGVVSVLRGFTPEELADTVSEAVAQKPVVRRRRGFRVTASWAPVHAVTRELARPLRSRSDAGRTPDGDGGRAIRSRTGGTSFRAREQGGKVAVSPLPLPIRAVPRAPRPTAEGWWRCPPTGRFTSSDTREAGAADQLANMVAVRDVGGHEADPRSVFGTSGVSRKGMDVEWTFAPVPGGTHVRIVHLWDGPRIPVVGKWAATFVIGPVFVHGIASRTLAGLASVAEREGKDTVVKRGIGG